MLCFTIFGDLPPVWGITVNAPEARPHIDLGRDSNLKAVRIPIDDRARRDFIEDGIIRTADVAFNGNGEKTPTLFPESKIALYSETLVLWHVCRDYFLGGGVVIKPLPKSGDNVLILGEGTAHISGCPVKSLMNAGSPIACQAALTLSVIKAGENSFKNEADLLYGGAGLVAYAEHKFLNRELRFYLIYGLVGAENKPKIIVWPEIQSRKPK